LARRRRHAAADLYQHHAESPERAAPWSSPILGVNYVETVCPSSTMVGEHRRYPAKEKDE
jgi:hypothetical protein